MKKIVLRIDDIGASTKKYEVYSKNPVGNILFLKYLDYFKAWGPYTELKPTDWEKIFEILIKKNVLLTVGITASWVNKDSSIIPFPEKFPLQADLLKQALSENIIEIANHGLTHCVVGKHLPKFFFSNRKYHREFWEWIPRDVHFEHLEKSQQIFKNWLNEVPTSLIPPGNVYSTDTLEAAETYGIKLINSYMNYNVKSAVKIVDLNNIDAFHDREIVLDGISWFAQKIDSYKSQVEFILLKDSQRSD